MLSITRNGCKRFSTPLKKHCLLGPAEFLEARRFHQRHQAAEHTLYLEPCTGRMECSHSRELASPPSVAMYSLRSGSQPFRRARTTGTSDGAFNRSSKTCCSLHPWNTRLAGPWSEINLSVLVMCPGTPPGGGASAWSITLGLLRAWDNHKLKAVYSYLLTGAGQFPSTPGPLGGSDYTTQPVWSPAAGAPVSNPPASPEFPVHQTQQ